jgi:hypothetical protein
MPLPLSVVTVTFAASRSTGSATVARAHGHLRRRGRLALLLGRRRSGLFGARCRGAFRRLLFATPVWPFPASTTVVAWTSRILRGRGVLLFGGPRAVVSSVARTLRFAGPLTLTLMTLMAGIRCLRE